MRDDGPRDLAVDVTPYAQSLVVPTQSQTKDRQDDGLSLDEQPTVQLESAQAALESAVDITQAKTVKVPAIHSKLPISAESTASPAKMQLIDGNSSFVREWPTDAEWRRARQLRWVKLVIASFIEALLISSILLAAVALRMWHLDAPGLSVREMNFLSQVEDTTDVAFNNPFSSRSAVYPFILRRWISAFGASDMAVRGLSVLCGVLTVAVVYLLARRLAGRNVALISAALLAVAPLHIAYSQLVSRYALLMLASSVLVLLTLLLLEQPKSALRWAGWIASAIILVNIGMSGLILIFSLGVICALKLRYSVWNLIGLGVALAAIATTLLLEVALIWGNGLLVVNEGLPIATTSLVANTLIAYGVGSFDQSLPGLLALPFVALVALGVRLLVHARRDMEMGLLVVWLLGTPVVFFII
jgi:4-amino-4-deoxy-L-arabinose transferase-like glycosyltransferase